MSKKVTLADHWKAYYDEVAAEAVEIHTAAGIMGGTGRDPAGRSRRIYRGRNARPCAVSRERLSYSAA